MVRNRIDDTNGIIDAFIGPLHRDSLIETQVQRLWSGSDDDLSDALRYQYLIAETPLNLPGFSRIEIGRKIVHVGSGLNICRLEAIGGQTIGFVLGLAVAPNGLLQNCYRMQITLEDPAFFDRFEQFIKHLAGRYGVILHARGETRFYCDPVGMIGAVYEPRQRRLAASPLLTIDREVLPHPLYDHRIVEDEGGKYSLFHTNDAHIRRQNPNCYLDLDNFSETRFWPRDEVFSCDPARYDDLYDEMAETTAFTIGEVARHYNTALPVSGGQDSRLIAAMSKAHLPKIWQYFTQVHNFAARVDASVASKVCDVLSVPHETLNWRKHRAPQDQIDGYAAQYRAAIGYNAQLPAELEKGLVFGVQSGDVVLRGHQTDLLRAVFHFRPQKRAWNKPGWQIKHLLIVPLDRFDAEVKSRFTPEFAAWQTALPQNAREKAVDFMFLEIYYASTLGATFPAASRNFFISPFNSRRMIELSLQIDDAYRRKSHSVHDLLWRLNPKLARVPFDYEMEQLRKRPEPGVTEQNIMDNRIALTAERAGIRAKKAPIPRDTGQVAA